MRGVLKGWAVNAASHAPVAFTSPAADHTSAHLSMQRRASGTCRYLKLRGLVPKLLCRNLDHLSIGGCFVRLIDVDRTLTSQGDPREEPL